MTDEKKKDKKDGKEAKKVDDEQLKDVAGGFANTALTSFHKKDQKGGKGKKKSGTDCDGDADLDYFKG